MRNILGSARLILTTLTAAAVLPFCITAAHAQELLTNGDFEAGNFAGWNRVLVEESGGAVSRNFALTAPGANTPGSVSFATAPNAAGGSFYAVGVADAPGQSAMIQTFTVPASGFSSLTLTFQMFVNDQSESQLFGGPFVDPTGLDHTTGGTGNNNQHARVDILSSAAAPFSTASGDVVRNLYLGLDSPNLVNGYTSYSFDMTPFLTPGSTYQLRFAEVDNLSALNIGVDNVSLLASNTPPIVGASAPEPGTAAFFVTLTSLLLLARIRNATRRAVR